MRIGLDIDDVLFPWSQHAHDACERAGITNGAQITQWRFYEDYGCTADEFWDVVNAEYTDGMLHRDPYPGVTDLLASTREAGHTIHLVTARGFEGPLADMVRAATGAWALRHAPHDSLTFAKDKAAVAWDVFLDDSPANVRALHEAGRRCFLHDQPHNRVGCDDLTRVDNLAAFLGLVTGGTPDRSRPGLGTPAVTGAQPDGPVTQAGRPVAKAILDVDLDCPRCGRPLHGGECR